MRAVTVSRAGRGLRLTVTAAVLALLAWGSLAGQDDHFPVGPFVMFAFTTASDGAVRSARVEARTDRGDRVAVALEPDTVGLRRAELEGQLDRVVGDARLLAGLASAHSRLHPRAPRYVQVDLVMHTVHLRRGVAAGESDEVLATWRAVPR
jgi:hypothetical protein